MCNVVRRTTVVIFTLAFIAIPSLLIGQTNGVRIGKTGAIELNQATRFGNQVLPPGHYEVQHTSSDGQDYLVVRQRVQPTRRHSVQVTAAEVARVPCQIVALEGKPRFSFAYWKTGTDGMPTVTEIRIAEEPAGHLIALKLR
jgi:hypothetical protein